jgi:hypothetical protein
MEYHTVGNRQGRDSDGAIFTRMAPAKALLGFALSLAVVLPAGALAASSPSRTGKAAATSHSPLQSRELWATINVCNPKDQPDYVGVRGSMPGDRHPRDRMFMRFRLQYLNSSTNHWADIVGAVPPQFVKVGTGASARQEGESFLVMPVAGRPAFTFRGLVEFQWRRGKTVLMSAKRPTTAGRRSAARADPPGFSAPTCLIG